MEYIDDRFIVPSAEPTSRLLCHQCPPSGKRLAVSVCSYEKESLFRGCNQPFCAHHAFLVQHIEHLAGLPEDLKAVLPKLKNTRSLEEASTRCCLECKPKFVKNVQASPRSQAIIRKAAVTLCLLLAIIGVFFVASKDYLMRMEELSKKCQVHTKYSELLDQCFKFLPMEMLGEEDALRFLLYRGEITCYANKNLRYQYCSCVIFGQRLDRQEYRCVSHKCNPETHYLSHDNGCNSKEGLRLSSDQTHGCVDGQMWLEELGICIVSRCPNGHFTKSDGHCGHCMPYSPNSHYCHRLHFQEYQLGMYSTITGKTKLCPEDPETGESIPFYDQLGQLQCPNSSLLDKYDRSLPPEQRPCKQSEIYIQKYVGCHFACPAFEVYDFINHRCFRPTCEPHWYNHETTGCQSCHSQAKYECLRDDWFG